jgi:hypothetical protein
MRPKTLQRDELAERTRLMWQGVLTGGTQVAETSDFFELGGRSVQGARIILRMNEEFEVKLPIRLIFDAPVFADFVDRAYQVVLRGGQDRDAAEAKG